MERLQVAESERKLLHKRLFGTDEDSGHPPNMTDVLHKVESLFQERDGLVRTHYGCKFRPYTLRYYDFYLTVSHVNL